MFKAALFIIAKRWKQYRIPINWYMNKQNIIYNNNGKLCGNKKEWVLIYATWMNLENIMLSERSQTQKVTHLYEISRTGRSIEAWNRLVIVNILIIIGLYTLFFLFLLKLFIFKWSAHPMWGSNSQPRDQESHALLT